ncbi:hypothetical protein Tco_0033438 [Tanacetum coccineum]
MKAWVKREIAGSGTNLVLKTKGVHGCRGCPEQGKMMLSGRRRRGWGSPGWVRGCVWWSWEEDAVVEIVVGVKFALWIGSVRVLIVGVFGGSRVWYRLLSDRLARLLAVVSSKSGGGDST